MRKLNSAVILTTVALVLAGCGSGDVSEEVAEPDDSEADTGLSTGTVASPVAQVPESVELGQDYTFEMPEGQFDARFTAQIPPGAVVTVTASTPDGNQGHTSVSVGPAGQSIRRFDLPAGAEDSLTYVTSRAGGGGWNVEVNAAAGDVVAFRVEAPLQADGGVPGDAGTNAGETVAMELGVPLTGMLGDEDAEDWYAIPLAGGDVVTVALDMTADPGTGHLSAEIIHNGSGFGFTQVSPGGEETMTQIFAEDQTGEAQLRVSGGGIYGFTVEAGPQVDGGSEGDAGGDLSTAKPVEFGTVDGVVGGQDGDDYYLLTMPQDAVITVDVTGAADQLGPMRVGLTYNGANIENISVAPGQAVSAVHGLVNDADEQVFLHVSGLGGAYSITIGAATQPDGGDGAGDAPNDRELAKEVAAEGSFAGHVNNARGVDNVDFYRFTATATAALDITLTVDAEVGANTNIRVFGPDGRQLQNASTGKGGSTTVTVDTEQGLEYVIQVGSGQQAAYTLTFG